MVVLQNASILTGEEVFLAATALLLAGWALNRKGKPCGWWCLAAAAVIFLAGAFFVLQGILTGLPAAKDTLLPPLLIPAAGAVVWGLLWIRISRVHHEEARTEQSAAVISAVVQILAANALGGAGTVSLLRSALLMLTACAVLAVQITASILCRRVSGRARWLANLAVCLSAVMPLLLILVLAGS